jgi:Relaxase/Mobilisation nuclease domain
MPPRAGRAPPACRPQLAEGEHLTREQWEDAAGRVLASMGLADHQAVLIAHHDTDHEHAHIVVNRIGDDGRAWRTFRDMVHAHEAIPGIEIDYGLSRTGRDQAPPDLNAGAVRETMRTGVRPSRMSAPRRATSATLARP